MSFLFSIVLLPSLAAFLLALLSFLSDNLGISVFFVSVHSFCFFQTEVCVTWTDFDLAVNVRMTELLATSS